MNEEIEEIEELKMITEEENDETFNDSEVEEDAKDVLEVIEEKDDKVESVSKDITSIKKKNNTPIYIILILLILGSCIAMYFYAKGDKDKASSNSNSTSNEKKEDKSILFTKDTLPRVDASLATQPLVDEFVLNFTGKTTKENGVEYSNTHPGYVKLINKQVDLIVVTEPSTEELALAKKNNVELEVTKVVNEGFVFFVNKNNPVESITFDQLQKIYTGEITNWKQLGGSDAKIIAFQRPVNSGSQTGLLSLVMKGKKVKTPTTTEQIETMAGIIDVFSDYDNSINAIGYSYYYYANTMYKNDDTKYLGINGIKPEYKTIQDGTYPIMTAYYIVTRKGETNENVLKLKEAMLSSRGQNVATKAGYVPVK